MSGSEPDVYVSSEAGNKHTVEYWRATAHQEKIVKVQGVNEYNPLYIG